MFKQATATLDEVAADRPDWPQRDNEPARLADP